MLVVLIPWSGSSSSPNAGESPPNNPAERTLGWFSWSFRSLPGSAESGSSLLYAWRRWEPEPSRRVGTSLHLCREPDCQGGPGEHCTSYSAVDAESLVHHGAYGKVSAWRIGVLILRGLRSTVGWTARCFLCCGSRRRSRTRRFPQQHGARQIRDQGVLRALDPESESEIEVVHDPCESVRVGLPLNGKQHARASDDCQDRAAPESTLLDEDRNLSDLGGSDAAKLCAHRPAGASSSSSSWFSASGSHTKGFGERHLHRSGWLVRQLWIRRACLQRGES